MMFSPPQELKDILFRLNHHGFSAYLVGGCVRDFLREKTPKDWDVTTNALPHQVEELFEKTYQTGKRHGTITVVHQGLFCEVTTYRIDGEYENHRRPKEVLFTTELQEDLKRRDFTINAMAWHPKEGLIDFFGGQKDLEKRILRTVGSPQKRLTEDALRILRGVRFAASFNLQIEAETLQGMKQCAPLLEGISAERKREEFFLMLHHAPAFSCRLLENLTIFPYLAPGISCNSPALAALEKLCRPHWETAFTLLLFFQKDSTLPLLYFKCSKETQKRITTLLSALSMPLSPTSYELKKIMSKLSAPDLMNQFFNLKEALGNNMCEPKKLYISILLNKEPYRLKDLAVNGTQVLSWGVQGKEVGVVLEYLLDQVRQTPENNHLSALFTLAKKGGFLL